MRVTQYHTETDHNDSVIMRLPKSDCARVGSWLASRGYSVAVTHRRDKILALMEIDHPEGDMLELPVISAQMQDYRNENTLPFNTRNWGRARSPYRGL